MDQVDVNKDNLAEIDKQQAEYLDEWNAAGTEEGENKPPDGEGTTDADNNNLTDLETKKADELQPESQGAAPETVLAADKDKDHGSIEAVTKALKDTQSYATKLAQEIAELKKSKTEGTEAEIAAQQKKTDEAKADLNAIANGIYEDYPELKALVDPLLAKTRSLESEVTTLKKVKEADAEKEVRAKAKEAFESTVKPNILKKHGDFDAIIKTEAYWKWANEQRPGIRFMAMDSDNPDDICTALSEYKKSGLYKADIDQIKAKDQQRRETITNAQSLRGGSTSFPAPRNQDAGKDDYEAGWKEGEAEEKRAAAGR